MKNPQILIIAFLLSCTVYAQQIVSLRGYIIDKETNDALPYVNIGFINEAVGTVSDEDGFFDIRFKNNKISSNATLQISSIGYKTQTFSYSNFVKQLKKSNKIFLEPDLLSLDEIVLTNEKRRENFIGLLNLDEKTVGYWLNAEALGGEIATLLPIKTKNTKLHDLKFYITKNNSQNIKVRVNIYEYKRGFPEKNLLSKNIIHNIKSRSTGVERVNLEPYGIVVNNDVVVSLELVNVGGKFIDFEIGGSKYKTHSFTREISQDKWKRADSKGLAFRLRTSYPSNNGKVIRERREIPTKLTLYWDTSKDGATRNFSKEYKLLSKYLKELKSCSIEVIKFNSSISQKATFEIVNGSSKELISYLKNSIYNGEANFSNILKDNEFDAEAILLFSSGNSLISTLDSKVYIPIFSINSNDKADFNNLENVADYAGGTLINLRDISVDKGLEFLQTNIKNLESYSNKEDEENWITGFIKSDTIPIAGANIKVKNRLTETTSSIDGNYKIKATKNDVLVIRALGMDDKEIPVQDKNTINIFLNATSEVLDEITLYANVNKKAKLINTRFGKKNIDAIGYQNIEITSKQINSSHTHLDQLVAKLPGVIINGIGDSKRYNFTRSMGSSILQDTSPIIVIDGIIHFQYDGLDKLPPLDIQTIKSIKALKSLASTNKYGSAGAYGVIEIQTEASALPDAKTPQKDITQKNVYTEGTYPNYTTLNQTSAYLEKLKKSSSFYDAKEEFNSQNKKSFNKAISYYISTSEYFEKWDKDFAVNIATSILNIAKDNPKALKSLAYRLDKNNAYQLSLNVYKRIKDLKPNDAQSYIDLALAYENAGKNIEALDLYKSILGGTIEQVNFNELQSTIATNFKRFASKHKNKLDLKGIPTDYLSNKFDFKTRIVFQWSHPNHQFEMQFVNPKNQFFKWSHTLADNKELLIRESALGFTTQEFTIDKADIGKWLINIESMDDKIDPNNPPSLKYIRYDNYGQINEQKTVKVIPLNFPYKKVNLDSFIVN